MFFFTAKQDQCMQKVMSCSKQLQICSHKKQTKKKKVKSQLWAESIIPISCLNNWNKKGKLGQSYCLSHNNNTVLAGNTVTMTLDPWTFTLVAHENKIGTIHAYNILWFSHIYFDGRGRCNVYFLTDTRVCVCVCVSMAFWTLKMRIVAFTQVLTTSPRWTACNQLTINTPLHSLWREHGLPYFVQGGRTQSKLWQLLWI